MRITIKNRLPIGNLLLVEHKGFEPLTSSMPWKRATNCANAPCTFYYNLFVINICSMRNIFDQKIKNRDIAISIFYGGGGWNRTNYQVVMSRLL